MGACCKPVVRRKPSISVRRFSCTTPPLLYFISHPYLYTYSPLHRTTWKEELSYDGLVDSHYRACMLSPTEMLVITLGQTLLVCVELSSALRLAPIQPSGIWKGDLHSYEGRAYAVSHAVSAYEPGKDIWEKLVDYWSDLGEYFGSSRHEGDIYIIGAALDKQIQGVIRKLSLVNVVETSIVYFDNIAKLPLVIYAVGRGKIALIGDNHQIVYNIDSATFSKTTLQLDRSPAVLQYHSETSIYVLKETGYVLHVTRENSWETKVQDREETTELGSVSTLLEHDKRVKHRPGLYTYAVNFEEEDYFCVRLDTLALTVKVISAKDEPLIAKGAGVCLLPDGDLMLAGGFDKQMQYTAEVMLWNPCADVRSATTALPHPQAFVVLTVDGLSIYALGSITEIGQKQGVLHAIRSHFQQYDLETSHWTELSPPPVPLLYPGLAALKEAIYAFGGSETSQISTFLPSRSQWVQLSLQYPEPLTLILAVNIGDLLLCFSGIQFSTQTPSYSSYLFDGCGFRRGENSPFTCDRAIPMLGFGRHGGLVCVVENSGVWSTYDWRRDCWSREAELVVSEDTIGSCSDSNAV